MASRSRSTPPRGRTQSRSSSTRRHRSSSHGQSESRSPRRRTPSHSRSRSPPRRIARRVVDLDEDREEWENEEDEALELEGVGTTSHRSRNPHKPSVPVRKHVGRTRVGMRAVQTTKRIAKNDRLDKLKWELHKLEKERDARFVELAAEFGMKKEEVRRRAMGVALGKHKRESGVYNAKMSWIAKNVVNKDRPVGTKLRMPAVRRMVEADPSLWEQITPEMEKEILAAHKATRETQINGTRANNLACQITAKKMVDSIGDQMISLTERTGVIGCAFFTHTNAHDKTTTYWVESDAASDFIPHAFKKSIPDMMRMYELWALSRDKVSQNKELQGLQQECRDMIKTNYCHAWPRRIRQVHVKKQGVGLVNWPKEVPFLPAGQIGALPTIKILHEALKSGKCHWKKLDARQKEKLIEQHEDMLASGEIKTKSSKKGGKGKGGARSSQRKEVDDSDVEMGVGSDNEEEEEEEEEEDWEMVQGRARGSEQRERLLALVAKKKKAAKAAELKTKRGGKGRKEKDKKKDKKTSSKSAASKQVERPAKKTQRRSRDDEEEEAEVPGGKRKRRVGEDEGEKSKATKRAKGRDAAMEHRAPPKPRALHKPDQRRNKSPPRRKETPPPPPRNDTPPPPPRNDTPPRPRNDTPPPPPRKDTPPPPPRNDTLPPPPRNESAPAPPPTKSAPKLNGVKGRKGRGPPGLRQLPADFVEEE
ncbi:hypothetical protein FB45DRAFT_1084821 [Roridomyces roridus]|uniref:Uncharacterized protein n=1 Tax=Roridomyces roridus TaxID=1738132 RepID=A0AAD7BP11_9AGAR|nr:hypothetical protein FB45DRAFT_1084821 [Roridomyces roridus]